MPTIVPTLTPFPSPGDVRGYNVAWGPMANGDVGQSVILGAFADRSVQVEGTFGAGGNAEIQGSNDGTTYRPLRDPFGVLLDITAGALKQVVETSRLFRPAITAGDGTTSLTVTAYMGGSVSRLGTGGGE